MRICRNLLPALLSVAAAQAAITDVNVVGATPTQAVISYTAPDASACTIRVSTSPTYSPLVNDVNPALFVGANLDSRIGSVADGRARTFVAGSRTAQMAADGKYYSRALQAVTLHYFQIACESDTASGTFTTANLALGAMYNDPFPRDPNIPGRYAWPTIDYTYPTTPGNGTLSSNGTSITFATAETLNANDYIVLTSGPNTGQQARVANVGNSKSATLANAFSRGQAAGTTWARRTPEKTGIQQIIDPLTGLLIRRISNAQQLSANSYGVAPTVVTAGAGWTNASATSLAKADSNSASYAGDANQSWMFVHVPTGISSYVEGYYQMDWITVTVQGSGNGTGNDNAVQMCLTANGSTCLGAMLTVNLATCAPWAQVGSQCWVGTEIPLEAAWQSPSDAIGSLLDPVAMNGPTGGLLIRKMTTTANTVNIDYLAVNVGLSSPAEEYTLGAQVCSNALATQTYNGTSRQGYRCAFGTTQGFGYWIDSTSGDSVLSAIYRNTDTYRFTTNSGSNFDQTDATKLYGPVQVSGTTQLALTTYTGQNLDVGFAPSNALYFSGTITNLSGNLVNAMAAFSPDFKAHQSYWGNQILISGMVDNRYIHVNFFPPGLSPQDFIAYKGMFDVQAKQFVAATPTVGYYPARWCQLHTGGTGGQNLGWGQISSALESSGSACGSGLFQTELEVNLGLPGSGTGNDVPCPNLSIARSSTGGRNYCASVTVSGDMYKPTPCASENSNRGANGFLGSIQAARPGDILTIDSEQVQLLAKDPTCSNPAAPCPWTILRGVDGTTIAAHTPGVEMTGTCAANSVGGGDTYWDFLDDPYGTDETLTYKKIFSAAHGIPFVATDATTLLDVRTMGNGCGLSGTQGGCYAVFSGNMGAISAAWLAGNYPSSINYTPLFANQLGYPNYPDSHPSLRQTNDYRWILDGRPYYGPIPTQTWTPVSGALYKTSTGLNEKVLPTEASCGARPATDVTPGPLTANAPDAYKFCYGTGCYAGAGVNEIYLNCPDATTLSCSNSGSDDTLDMCVHDLSPVGHVYEQVGITPVKDRAGAFTRLFGTPFGRHRRDSAYRTMSASPDGQWGFFLAHWLDGMRTETMAAKLPPWPAKRDTYNRGTFIPMPVAVPSPPSGTNNVVAEFGYDTNFHCTSRQEACEAVSATVNETTPFYWASESYSGASGAPYAIVIPAISQRVLYCHVKYRDATNTVIGTGPTQVQVVP